MEEESWEFTINLILAIATAFLFYLYFY